MAGEAGERLDSVTVLESATVVQRRTVVRRGGRGEVENVSPAEEEGKGEEEEKGDEEYPSQPTVSVSRMWWEYLGRSVASRGWVLMGLYVDMGSSTTTTGVKYAWLSRSMFCRWYTHSESSCSGITTMY